MTCNCAHCRSNPHRQDGTASTFVMISSNGDAPVVAATIQIQAVPLLVQPWMLQKVLHNASKQLSQFIIQDNQGKVHN